ncbi:MAG: HDOD domain-containing protein, partial [Candidatus Coatesbacteria bacterium]|nr:HDOD domain-containing protein [Candidatus Coatesbacteria bacterium]
SVAGYGLDKGVLWEHSIAVAITAEEIAKAIHVQAPDITFTAALLHDIGKPVLGSFIADEIDGIEARLQELGDAFDEEERASFGIDHAEIGALILEKWGLPQVLVDVVRHHHRPGSGNVNQATIDVVHVADALCLSGGFGTGRDGLQYRPSRDSLARLNVTIHLLESVACETIGRIAEAKKLFAENMEGN